MNQNRIWGSHLHPIGPKSEPKTNILASILIQKRRFILGSDWGRSGTFISPRYLKAMRGVTSFCQTVRLLTHAYALLAKTQGGPEVRLYGMALVPKGASMKEVVRGGNNKRQKPKKGTSEYDISILQ